MRAAVTTPPSSLSGVDAFTLSGAALLVVWLQARRGGELLRTQRALADATRALRDADATRLVPLPPVDDEGDDDADAPMRRKAASACRSGRATPAGEGGGAVRRLVLHDARGQAHAVACDATQACWVRAA
jgi:hypothetical protein